MGRKRANTTKNKNTAEVKIKPRVPSLQKGEGQYFQELVDVSNLYASLQTQEAQYKFIIEKLEENRKKIQDGEIKLPLRFWLIPNLVSYPESDKKKIFKFFDEQITGYKNSLKTLKGTITHRYEEYAESAVRTREFVTKRFASLKAGDIVPDRKTIEGEENLFEAEFNKLMEDPETMKDFKKAKAEAIKENTKRETKKSKKPKKIIIKPDPKLKDVLTANDKVKK